MNVALATTPRPDVLAPLAAVAWTLEPPGPRDRNDLLRDELAFLLDRLLVRVARGLGALEVAIGEGLAALEASGRLIRLGPSRVGDYAREELDLAPGNALGMVRLARALRDRPLLREAVRRGEVTRRRAETIVAVARGTDEAAWVERARGPETVRELAAAVRAAGGAPAEDDEKTWERVTLALSPDQRAKLDAALDLAGDVLDEPAPPPWKRLEVVCQEYLGYHPIPETAWERDAALPPSIFDPCGDLEAIKAGLEYEFHRWDFLEEPERFEAPAGAVGDADLLALDARLHELSAMRTSWDELVGHLGLLVQTTGVWRDMQFASVSHYAAERLGMCGRALEQRAALERKLWTFPALRTALREKRLTYEKARVVAAHATEATLDALVARAEGLTVLALRRELEEKAGEAEAAEAQMCGSAERTMWLPGRVEGLLQATVQAAREAAGRWLTPGEALALAADHFLETYAHEARRPRTPAQRAIARDRGRCSFPGCSRPAVHGHHVQLRSQGGSDALSNLGPLCAPHHLVGVHGGFLRVTGQAPDALHWTVLARARS